MDLLVLIVHVLAAAAIIGLVLVQHGKGADVGAAFGTGSAGSVFGSAGSANFLSRLTAGLAVLFFCTSIGLSFLSNKKSIGKGVMSSPPAATQPAGKADVPAAPAVKGDVKVDAPAAPGVPAAPAGAGPAGEGKK
ncbi:MAG: preprotein translocase subunit SecG [Betaproteobacteria bacterium]|nr:preprotein translocase subunit SecG [Betaproteobacteria bacterium]